MVRDFKQAWHAGDINALIGLLDPDATAIGDGGGLVGAAPHPVRGAERIARFLVERVGTQPGVAILERTVNGQPGLVVQLAGVTSAVLAFDIAGDRIRHIWSVLNPHKLRAWTADSPTSPEPAELDT